MRKPTISRRHVLVLLTTALILTLAACGAQGPVPTPTLDVTAVYTAAFQTLAAQQTTQAALTPPTVTASATLAPTTGIPATGATGTVPNTGGATAAPSGAQACNGATYASDITVPDGTVMTPGQNFVKTWAVKNTGTCPWTTDYKLVFLSGESMGGTSAPLTASVDAGQTGNISVALVAPTPPGAYTGSWRLQDASGTYFGDVITVVVTVSGSGGSTSPTATSTP